MLKEGAAAFVSFCNRQYDGTESICRCFRCASDARYRVSFSSTQIRPKPSVAYSSDRQLDLLLDQASGVWTSRFMGDDEVGLGITPLHASLRLLRFYSSLSKRVVCSEALVRNTPR